MKTVLGNLRYWVGGIALAAGGLTLVRALAPTLTGHARVAAVLAGELVAIMGLVVICLGVSRWIRREEQGGSST